MVSCSGLGPETTGRNRKVCFPADTLSIFFEPFDFRHILPINLNPEAQVVG